MRILSMMLTAVSLLAAGPWVAAEDRPNVLFISIDDLNDWVGCYRGHPQIQTPHIDRLAEQGVRFSNAHCQAPICNPSRVSMLLGKLPSTTGMYFLAPNFRTVPTTDTSQTLFQSMREAGYYATTRGKIFHGPADPASFDHIEKSRGWRRDQQKLRFTLPGTHPLWDWGQVEVPDEEQLDYQTAAWAAAELPKLAAREQPFVLAVGFHLPHVPIYASAKWFDLYPLESIQLPETLSNDRDDVPEIAKLLTDNPTAPRHAWMSEHDEWRHAVRAYLAANSYVDYLVGMVLDGLVASGAADQTIIVLWSDHGFHLGEKQRWAKRSLWEETTRVPLIFAGPGIQAGAICDRPVGLLDVYPTLIELCQLAPRADLDGQSLQPLLKDPQLAWSRPALCTFGPGNHSLRSQRWRYTRYADGSEELYDHASDPHEWTNLAFTEELRQTHAPILAELRHWLPRTDAPLLPGSAGSDSPLYGEGDVSLEEAMRRGAARRDRSK